VRLLIDASLSWRLARLLAVAGHDVVHADVVAPRNAKDPDLIEVAIADRRVIVTRDKADFGEAIIRSPRNRWLSIARRTGGSLILLRRVDKIDDQAELLLRWMPQVEDDLAEGAIVTLAPGVEPRIRKLPGV
jgi:predicted nuclease of predicted toxin-antitoxin system